MHTINKILTLIIGVFLGWSLTKSHYQIEINKNRVSYWEDIAEQSKIESETIAKLYVHLIESNNAQREAYYGFGLWYDRLSRATKDLSIHHKNYVSFLKADCNNDIEKSCVYLGNYYLKRKDFDLALPYLEKGAESGSLKAISSLIDLYRHKKWAGADENIAKKWIEKLD